MKLKLNNLKILTVFVFTLFFSCKKASHDYSTDGRNPNALDGKIGFVDKRVIESKMVALKNVEKSFLKEEGKIRKTLMEKKSGLEERYKGLEKMKNDGLLDRKGLEKKAKEIEKDFIELQQSEKEAGDIMNFVKMQISFEIGQKIQECTRKVVEDIKGDDVKYLLVFDASNLLFVDNAQIDDLTSDVSVEINKTFKVIDIEKYFEDAKKALARIKKMSSKDK